MRKWGLVLGAGGARGAAHVGFLQALEEESLRPDLVAGCSMGAVVGACYCAGVPVQTIKERLLALKLWNIASLNVAPLRANGLFRFTKARKILHEYLGEKTFEELGIPFACVATDLERGESVLFCEGNVLDAVVASSSVPGAFTPATVGGRQYVDGGVTERVPVKAAKKMGAEFVVAVDVLGDLMQKRPAGNLVDTLLRCFDIMDTRAALRRRRSEAKNVLYLEPELGGMDQYSTKNLGFAYQKGYELGKERAETIKSLRDENGSV